MKRRMSNLRGEHGVQMKRSTPDACTTPSSATKAVCIFAQEFGGLHQRKDTLPGPRTPAMYVIDAERLIYALAAFEMAVEGHPPEPSEWMQWDDQEKTWTFAEWYWSVRLRTWSLVRFQVQRRPGVTENVAFVSISDRGPSSDCIVESMMIDTEALLGIAHMALHEKCHVMAVPDGFQMFRDFAAFEDLLLDYVVDRRD